jgi:peptidoglycan/xylan/chitin deacetylase (PgdA/CDA1 family)
MYRMLAAVVTVALVSTTPTTARGDGWPAPAAGLTQTGDPEIIFTFDDGPDPRHTELVLDELKAHNIHAIFFEVGWRFQRGDIEIPRRIVDRILDEHHVIGNHSITHAQLCQLDPEGIDREMAGAREILERETQMPVVWFRVPYGAYCPRVLEALHRNGYQHFHWDIDPQEWQGKPAKTTAAYVIRQLARLDGRAVLLMHDTKPATVAALPEILAWLDTENARRKSIGRRQIRVIQSYELAAERAKPTIDWLAKATTAARDRVEGALAANVP